MSSVSLRKICKTYSGADSAFAVRDFDLEIADREFIVLVGPSGCGKSTTLRMIAGLEDISSGELIIDGRVVNDVAPKDRDIAMVFQNYALYPHMTVFENMAFALRLRKTPQAEIDRRVREAAEILGITQFLDRKPKALSGGQRQRVAIGRAIVRSPKVFLMDEPLSNLDAKLRNQMRTEIIKLRRRIDTTFVYVTHDQTEAMTLSDRIVIMKDGVIQQIGEPQHIFDAPANTFVAGFIGMPQMNIFDAELSRDGERWCVTYGGLTVPMGAAKQAKLTERGAKPGRVLLGIRPEHLRVSAADAHSIAGTIDVCEMMGSAVHLHISTSTGDDAVAVVMTSEIADRSLFEHGRALTLTFSGEDAHLFDAESGVNIAV